MIIKLLTEHHLEFLSLKGGCRGLSESTLVKMSNCWKSHAAAHIIVLISGEVGDWKNHFTVAEAEQFDKLLHEEFKDTNIKFTYSIDQ